MKKIKIAHLYYDLMNLYGENGNIRFLKKKLEEQNMEVEVHFLSIEDKIDYRAYDVYYIGTGSEENQTLVLEHMLEQKQSILEAIHSNTFFIATGNALELFGKGIKKKETYLKALGAFNYEAKEEEFRIVGEQLYTKEDQAIIGFQNRTCTLNEYQNPLFDVIKGTGYHPNSKKEGIKENHFYGTYLLGPFLVRNPHFCDTLIKEICNEKEIPYQEPDQEQYEYKAYRTYLENFYPEQRKKRKSSH